ncbi:uncharacterized protein MONBRDRAFT_13313 [Monosiga brevicollis MX1]|uniref:Uncharacterized protein n=1 Tax=Monosiga brevicollis TaxID=81824 RepID=A9UP38_MONBE|nr:uncharacterized protein MONBRDRAFT_13313 [Monosiga brevicollis MX1]EDQ92806.1 predicted protein [Monosiga brevicollis MX1]|eukprot:XP_001742568.1 hypothetical protein [Monosiga brevicollis MX1]
MASAITACSAWVPQGAAKENPDKVELSQDDLQALIENAKTKLGAAAETGAEDAESVDEAEMADAMAEGDAEDGEWEDVDDEDDEDAGAADMDEPVPPMSPVPDDDADLEAYNMADYDEEDAAETFGGAAGLGNLTYYANNTQDPYIVMQEDDEDADDFRVKPTDNFVVVGRSEEALSHIEVHLYNEEEDSFFVHHDILLDSFPLALTWVGYDPGAEDHKGNLIAVGTMEKEIDLWDLDVIDAPEPAFKLGGIERSKKGKKKVRPRRIGHKKEVLSLAWNRLEPTLLASSSADTTVRLWSLEDGTCMRTYDHHSAPVENVAWNPQQATVLLTGAHDRTAVAFDVRAPEVSLCFWFWAWWACRVFQCFLSGCLAFEPS